MTKEEEAIILLSENINTSNYRNGAELEEALFIIANAIRHQVERPKLPALGIGRVAVTPAILEGKGCILLNEQEQPKIGELVQTKEEWYKNPLIRIDFLNNDGVDVLIRELNELKLMIELERRFDD
ncbi:MAG: hypothetical protein K6G88_11130 [Lachnospiraceae bacterium]|nr:hypothetical protein [Lachnospiraceae bacterium]